MKDQTIITSAEMQSGETGFLSEYSTHYQQRIYCKNCDHHDTVRIKKGTLKAGLSTTCEECGCEINL